MQDPKSLFQEGVRAIRDQRDLPLGRKLLTQSLKLDPNNDTAWIWLSRVVDENRRLQCLDRALEINPRNVQALKLKQRLQYGTTMDDGAPAVRPAKPRKKRPATSEFAAVPASKPAPGKDKEKQKPEKVSPDELGNVVVTTWITPLREIMKLLRTVGFFALGAAIYIYGPEYRGDPGDNRDALLAIVYGVSGLLALGGVMSFFDLVMNFGKKLAVADGGLILSQLGFKQAWRWEDFTAVQVKEIVSDNGTKGGFRSGGGMVGVLIYETFFKDMATTLKYNLTLSVGKKRVLKINNDFRNHREIGQMIERTVDKILFARLGKAYNAGETVEFGKIKVDISGVTVGRKQIPWADIREVTVEHQNTKKQMTIIHARGRTKANVNNMPNVNVLLKMIERLGRCAVFHIEAQDD